MAAQSQIVITTKAPNATIPVYFKIFDTSTANDGTFDPDGLQPNGMRKWSDKRSGVPAAYPVFSFGFKEGTPKSPLTRVQTRLFYPVMEEVSYDANGVKPGAEVAYSLQFAGDFIIPNRATALDRQIFVSYLYSVMATSLVKSDLSGAVSTNSPLAGAVLNLTPVW